jgi:hypothetical protein
MESTTFCADVRCAQGLNLLSKNQPVPNYQTWMFV